MYKLILLIAISSLTACAATNNGMQQMNKSPRGISILNVMKQDRAKAHRAAEKHCAKYYKVPRVLKSLKHDKNAVIPVTTVIFECLKPN
jgi:hypothetical protein